MRTQPPRSQTQSVAARPPPPPLHRPRPRRPRPPPGRTHTAEFRFHGAALPPDVLCVQVRAPAVRENAAGARGHSATWKSTSQMLRVFVFVFRVLCCVAESQPGAGRGERRMKSSCLGHRDSRCFCFCFGRVNGTAVASGGAQRQRTPFLGPRDCENAVRESRHKRTVPQHPRVTSKGCALAPARLHEEAREG